MLTTFPVQTSDFVLRPFTMGDAEGKFRLDSDPEIQKYLGNPLVSRERSARVLAGEIAVFAKQGYGLLAVAAPAVDRVFGYASLQPDRSRNGLELVLALASEPRPHDLAHAVAERLMQLGCGPLGAREIVGRVSPSNTKALKLLRRLNMELVEQTPEEHVYVWACSKPSAVA